MRRLQQQLVASYCLGDAEEMLLAVDNEFSEFRLHIHVGMKQHLAAKILWRASNAAARQLFVGRLGGDGQSSLGIARAVVVKGNSPPANFSTSPPAICLPRTTGYMHILS